MATLHLAGCTETIAATEVIVSVDAAPGIAAEIESVNVRVLGGAGRAGSGREERFEREWPPAGGSIEWPLKFVITPLDHDPSRIFEFVAEANDPNGPIGRVRAVSGFVPRETRNLTLTFTDGCRGRLCGEDKTCEAGSCVSASVDVADLSRSGEDGPMKVGDGVAPGDGDSDGDSVAPGDGDSVTPGDGDSVMPGDGDSVAPGDGDSVAPGDGDSVAPGDGDVGCTGRWDLGVFGQACWGE